MALKIKPEHLASLQAAIKPIDTAERRALYREGKFPRAELVKDLDKRYRWDLVWAIPAPVQVALTGSLYEYLNDDHIDSALRSIVPALQAEVS